MQKFISSFDKSALKAADGALLIVKWNQIEPAAGKFDFKIIDDHVSKCSGKKWSLAIAAGPSTPEFYKSGVCVDFLHRGAAKKMPVFWDSGFLDALALMLAAVGDRYKNDTSLSVVYAPQSSQNGAEGLLPAVLTKGKWAEFRYTPDAHARSALAVCDMLYKYFPACRTAIELHETFRTTTAQSQIISGLSERQYGGIACWWNGQGTYQPDLQELIAASALPVYCQNIAAYAKQPARFCDYAGSPVDKNWSAQMAADLGADYLEYWPADVR